jgi:hypothetical protein
MSLGHLLNILKREIKVKFNIEKLFNIFERLNAHVSRQNFYFNMLNHCSGHCLAFSLIYYRLQLIRDIIVKKNKKKS